MRLSSDADPVWVDLVDGAAVLAKPPLTPLIFLAQARADLTFDRIVEGAEALDLVGADVVGAPDLDSDEGRAMLRLTLFTVFLARLAIIDWRGVLDADADEDVEIQFAPEHVPHLLSNGRAARAFIANYLHAPNRVRGEEQRLQALAEWHFGKGRGQGYCDGCALAGSSCATLERSRCAYHAHAPRSEEGRIAWAVFQTEVSRVRTAGLGGIVGIERDVAMVRLRECGIAEDLAARLIGACERGFVAAVNEEQGGEDAGKES